MSTLSFLIELSAMPVHELAAILPRYIREACAADPVSAAQTISEAVYGALPSDDDGADPPRLLRVADFMAEVGDLPPALVAEFLPSKKLICLSGAAKQGKSLVGLEFLHCISTGHKLMGRFPIENPGIAVYFGLEDGGPEIKERLTLRGITDLDNFYICWQSFDMSTAPGLETFKRLVKGLPEPPALIIIDTAREAFRVRDWNDATAVGNAISPLRKWAHKNCTVILITHNNKDKFASGVNKISGSGALVSSCDSFMILENQKALENGDLRWDWEMAGRGMKTARHKLQMDTHTLHVRVLDGAEGSRADQETARDERVQWYERVANALNSMDGGAATVKQISGAVGCLYKFGYSLVRDMTHAGELEKTGEDVRDGEGAGRPSPLYRLSSKGASHYFFLPTAQGSARKELIPDDTEDL